MQIDDYFPLQLKSKAAAAGLTICYHDFNPKTEKIAFSVLDYPRNKIARHLEQWTLGFVVRESDFTALDGAGGTFELLEGFVNGLLHTDLNEFLTVYGVSPEKPEHVFDDEYYYFL
jgi:hypothetical protein